jgi:hypothetical protein
LAATDGSDGMHYVKASLPAVAVAATRLGVHMC